MICDELGQMMQWYWNILLLGGSSDRTQRRSNKACTDHYARRFREDPWFSSLWTVQEMVLAPASVLMARDGLHCRVDGRVVTTPTIGDKFQDFVVRERHLDKLESDSLNPSRGSVRDSIPESEHPSRMVMLDWVRWAFQKASITTSVHESRGGIITAALARKYTGRRDMAVLAAVKASQATIPDPRSVMVDDLAVSLWNALIRAEGGRIFDNNQPDDQAMASMLPSGRGSMNWANGIRYECSGWELKENGELRIPSGSPLLDISDSKSNRYEFPGEENIHGGDAVHNVKKRLVKKGIHVKHVRFVVLIYEPPIHPAGNTLYYKGIRGVILTTTDDNVNSDNCRWYKAGLFYATEYQRSHLQHGITVGAVPLVGSGSSQK